MFNPIEYDIATFIIESHKRFNWIGSARAKARALSHESYASVNWSKVVDYCVEIGCKVSRVDRLIRRTFYVGAGVVE